MGKSADLVVGLVMLDKFSKTFDKFNRDVTNSEKKSAGFGKALSGIGAAVSIGAITAFGTSAVKAYGDALHSQQLLMDAFAKQPQLMGYNVEALMAYNKELSTKIAYDDDEINAAQANLALFKLTGDQIKNLTPLVADLARRKGTDLATAATVVGKAMQGQARGLKDLGIVFKSTGDTAKDYVALQAVLQQQVGGTAEAFAQNNPLGQMQNMQIAFQNMQESIGQALVPAMTAFTNVMTPLANLIGSIPGPMMQIGMAVGVAALAARVAGPMMMSLVTSFRTGAGAAAQLTAAELTGAGAIGTQAGAAIAGGAAMRVLSGGMTAAAAAGKGLMASLGGPIGLAIVGITTAISLFSLSSDDAATSTDNWTSALERQNGALTENAKRQVIQHLADSGVIDALEKLGISAQDYTTALIEGGSARDALIRQLSEMSGHTDEAKSGWDRYNDTQSDTAKAAQTALSALAQNGKQLDDSTRHALQAAAATDEHTNSLDDNTNAAKFNARAIRDISGALTDYSQSSLQSALDQLAVQKQSLETAHALHTITDAEYNTLGENIARQTASLQAALDKSIAMFGDLSASADQASSSVDSLTQHQQRLLDTMTAKGQALNDVLSARNSLFNDVASQGMDFATVLGMTPEDAQTAKDAWLSAQGDVAKAQAALAAIGPADIEARTKAQDDLNAAIAKEKEAHDAADAAAYTPGNIVKSYNAKFNKLKAFATDIDRLTKAGVPQIILQDILDAGIDGGSAMARMLATHPGMMGKLKTLSAGIENQSARAGTIAANYLYSGAVATANAAYRPAFNAAKAGGATSEQPIEVVLKLDSQTVYKQLLRLRRERGGAGLGL